MSISAAKLPTHSMSSRRHQLTAHIAITSTGVYLPCFHPPAAYTYIILYASLALVLEVYHRACAKLFGGGPWAIVVFCGGCAPPDWWWAGGSLLVLCTLKLMIFDRLWLIMPKRKRLFWTKGRTNTRETTEIQLRHVAALKDGR